MNNEYQRNAECIKKYCAPNEVEGVSLVVSPAYVMSIEDVIVSLTSIVESVRPFRFKHRPWRLFRSSLFNDK